MNEALANSADAAKSVRALELPNFANSSVESRRERDSLAMDNGDLAAPIVAIFSGHCS